jgi:small conductance mechanosensitive channel
MEAFLRGILSKLQEIFDPEALGALVADYLASFIVGVFVFAAFYILWRLLALILRRVIKSVDLDETAEVFVMRVIQYVILTIGVVNALAAMGVDTGSVLASLGIVGVAVGFAARDAFSNLISGLLIFLDRPFVIGDLVEIGGEYGQVTQITLRSTRIVTSTGKMLAVPNADVINKVVASYTNFPHLRLDVPITIGVGEDIQRARRLLLSVVKNDADYLKDPSPEVVVSQLNDYNLELTLRVWLDDERDHVPKRFALREKMYEALRAAGVSMPYETLQLMPLKVEEYSA